MVNAMKNSILTIFLVSICCILLLAGCSLEYSMPTTTEPLLVPSFTTSTTNISPATNPTSTTEETIATVSTTTPATTEPTSIPENSYFEIHYIDVGQADAALLLCDGETMLIDGGNADDSSLIYSYLQNHEISHIDIMVATHGHEDHCGGLSGALNAATVGTVYSPVKEYDSRAFRSLVKYVQKQGKELIIPRHGDTFTVGSAVCTIIGPITKSDEPNNTSIVIHVQYGKTSFLFTGDAELSEETEIIEYGYNIDCDVLKVGHHGSHTSTGYRWLRESSPKYAVISVGKDNEYGHPTEAVLSKLRDADVKVYRTDMQGHIVCSSDGENITFAVERNADADTLIGAGAGGNHNTEPPDTEKPTTATTAPSESKAITYVCNTNTKKFHDPSCSSVKQMKNKNKKEVTSSRDELIAQGYSPCGRCHP